ncbi:hypothetical protein NYQ43_18170 [Xanthomonas translucens pv. translucens]|uniref:hypothetical protein n=1 Tax=Xanthomonas campestris pv. translucens TaxID=343 RepID=UPI0021B802A4|nr:hypothetical protein [Xanthomonas translucens]MCT8287564.1 hypothetical protein [Xanthomonas translucens pv. translucens]MCT8305222.1 hypothetical protein [Xanthomonas translucens pv. translucens]
MTFNMLKTEVICLSRRLGLKVLCVSERGGGRVWWALNQLSKEKEIYSFPANGLTPTCRAIDKLKQSARLDGDFEKKAYSTCKK